MRLLLWFVFFLFCSSDLSAKNEVLLQKIVDRAHESKSTSLVIRVEGHELVRDFFGGKDQTRGVASITKSVSALAIGVLLDEGKISSLALPLSTWFPEWKTDPQKSKITLKMIMNHTSGLPDVDTETGFWSKPDAVAAATQIQLTSEPGTRYLYSNIGSSLLQPVIEKASGQSVTDFVRRQIFSPLGIRDFTWDKDRAGHEITSGGLSLSTEALLKLGELILNRGNYRGQTILSFETFGWLTQRSQPYFPYGLLFWLDKTPDSKTENLISARGWGGQYVIVFPEKKLIVVRTRDLRGLNEEKRAQQAFQDLRSLVLQWE